MKNRYRFERTTCCFEPFIPLSSLYQLNIFVYEQRDRMTRCISEDNRPPTLEYKGQGKSHSQVYHQLQSSQTNYLVSPTLQTNIRNQEPRSVPPIHPLIIMDAPDMKAARETFILKRNALATELEVLSREVESKDNAAIISELRRISKNLEEYSLIGKDVEEDMCDCIPGKCRNLASIMEENADQIDFDQTGYEERTLPISLKKVYEMLTMQVGRLTLDNHRQVDGYALHFVSKVKDEDYRWALQTQGRDEKLYALWMRMNRVQEPGPWCSFRCLIMEATGPHGLENEFI